MNVNFNFDLSSVRTRPPQEPGKPRKLLKYLSKGEALMEIDNSSFENFSLCDRKAEFALVLGRIAPPSFALQYGNVYHQLLEYYYSCQMEGKPFSLLAAQNHATKVFQASPPPTGEWRTLDKLLGSFGRYLEMAKIRDNGMSVVRCEQAFTLPFVKLELNSPLAIRPQFLFENPDEIDQEVKTIHVSWTGKIDLLVKIEDDYYIVDHKTTSIEGPTYWKGFELSPQFAGYVWAAQKITGFNIKGVIINAIYGREDAKTAAGLRAQRDAEFNRHILLISQDRVVDWERNTARLLQDFIFDMSSGVFPMRPTSCVTKFGVCAYHEVCTLPTALRGPMLFSAAYHNNVWSPLES